MTDHALDMLLSTAIGILMERFGLSAEDAADRLGDLARADSVTTGDVARLLVVEVGSGARTPTRVGDVAPVPPA